jgi:sporulation protein YlmC with PRC-barrel domain
MKKLAIFTAILFTASLTLASTVMAAEYGAGEKRVGVGQQLGMQDQQVKAASDLKEFSLKDQQGQSLGQIDEVLVDIERGQIGYIVVTSETDQEKHIIPFNALEADLQQQTLTLDIDQQRFQQSPTGETVLDQQQAQQIHQFYGVSPYWEESGIMQRDPMQQQRSPLEDRQQQRQQQ